MSRISLLIPILVTPKLKLERYPTGLITYPLQGMLVRVGDLVVTNHLTLHMTICLLLLVDNHINAVVALVSMYRCGGTQPASVLYYIAPSAMDYCPHTELCDCTCHCPCACHDSDTR